MSQARFGLSTAHINHVSVAEAIDRCVELGVDGVEFFVEEYTVEQCREIADRAGEAELAIDYHAPWDGPYDFGLTDRDTALSHLEQAIARTRLMGATHCICHLGRYNMDISGGREQAIDNVIDITLTLKDAIRDAGVQLVYEDNTLAHDPNPLGDSIGDFARLFGAIDDPNVGMIIDTGHAHVTGNTRSYLEQFGRRVHYSHLNDNGGFGDDHLPPTSGTIDWPQIFEWFSYYGAAGSFAIEFNESYVTLELPRLRDLAAKHTWSATQDV
jgi:sugar phosphate isomerase/epimerase